MTAHGKPLGEARVADSNMTCLCLTAVASENLHMHGHYALIDMPKRACIFFLQLMLPYVRCCGACSQRKVLPKDKAPTSAPPAHLGHMGSLPACLAGVGCTVGGTRGCLRVWAHLWGRCRWPLPRASPLFPRVPVCCQPGLMQVCCTTGSGLRGGYTTLPGAVPASHKQPGRLVWVLLQLQGCIVSWVLRAMAYAAQQVMACFLTGTWLAWKHVLKRYVNLLTMLLLPCFVSLCRCLTKQLPQHKDDGPHDGRILPAQLVGAGCAVGNTCGCPAASARLRRWCRAASALGYA